MVTNCASTPVSVPVRSVPPRPPPASALLAPEGAVAVVVVGSSLRTIEVVGADGSRAGSTASTAVVSAEREHAVAAIATTSTTIVALSCARPTVAAPICVCGPMLSAVWLLRTAPRPP